MSNLQHSLYKAWVTHAKYWNSNWDRSFFPKSHEWRTQFNAGPENWTTHWTMSLEWIIGINVIYLFNVFFFQWVIMRFVEKIKQKVRTSPTCLRILNDIPDEIQKNKKFDDLVDKELEKTTFHKVLKFVREKPSGFMVFYNVTCVILSVFCVYFLLNALFTEFPNPSYYGNVLENTPKPATQFAYWLFYMSKFWEHIDTYSMVARLPRSHRQISFLHMYHHTTISLCQWAIMQHCLATDEFVPMLANSTIHVFMYSYYLASQAQAYESLNGPFLKAAVKAFRPWMTRMQLIQFIICFTQTMFIFVFGGSFTPIHISLLGAFYQATMLIGFGHFFYHNYMVGPPRTAKVTEGTGSVSMAAMPSERGH